MVAYRLEKGEMPVHDKVWLNSKRDTTTDINALVPCTWAKGCMVDDCACLINLI